MGILPVASNPKVSQPSDESASGHLREFFAAERVSVGAVAVSALSCQPPFIDCTPVNATRGVYESGGAKVCADWAL
jgi:hypothetical protein